MKECNQEGCIFVHLLPWSYLFVICAFKFWIQFRFRFTVIPDAYVVNIPHPDVPVDTSFKR